MIYEYKVNDIKHSGLRLDKYISLELSHLSRSKIKLLINNKMVLVNGKSPVSYTHLTLPTNREV